jgi:hypothetical protein
MMPSASPPDSRMMTFADFRPIPGRATRPSNRVGMPSSVPTDLASLRSHSVLEEPLVTSPV